MDFFGNVQDVEIGEVGGGWNESEWREDLRRLREIVERRQERARRDDVDDAVRVLKKEEERFTKHITREKRTVPAKVEAQSGWSQQILGAGALLGCALIWGGTSLLESS